MTAPLPRPDGYCVLGDRLWVISEPIVFTTQHLGADITITVEAANDHPVITALSVAGGSLSPRDLQRAPWSQFIDAALRAGATRFRY